MKAAVLVEPRRFEIRDVPVPEIGADDVLIRVERCGICGTDVHIFNGHYAAEKLPLVPGHEFAGTIARTGAQVRNLPVGTRAIVDINIGCGSCYYCRRNQILNCAEVQQIGISRDGGFAEYVAVPSRLVIPVPQSASFEILALTEPVACVVRAARKAGIGFADSVVILGAGPVGNLHVQLMRLIGAAPIIAAEPSVARSKLAKDAGADFVVTDPDELRAVVSSATDGRGADYVIESVGQQVLYSTAFDLIRPGGHVVAFGLTGPDDVVPLKLLDTVLHENAVSGSVAGMGQDMHDALTLLLHGRFQLDAFTGSEFELADIQAAFEALGKRPDVLKTQLVP